MDGHAAWTSAPIAAPDRRSPDVAVEELEIAGVRTFFAPHDGPTTAVLTFRVGQADESLPIRGITHMIEHLALHGVGQQHRETNGSVGMTTTNFVVRGSPDEVAMFLARLSASLRSLPVDRLGAEQRVLATERAQRARSIGRMLLLLRYGLRGYGLAGADEIGLKRIDAPYLQSWADYWFNRSNAVLWVVGELPDTLPLALPEGTWVPPPVPEPVPQPLPAWGRHGDGAVAISAVTPRDAPAWVTWQLAARRVEQRLRHRDATSYTVVADIDRWTADLAHAWIAADTLPENADASVDGMLGALGELAVEGPTDSELEELVREMATGMRSSDAVYGIADSMASGWLLRRRWQPSEELVSEITGVVPATVCQYLDFLRDQALLLVPEGARVQDRRLVPLASWSSSQVAGQALPRTASPDDTVARHRLLVGPEGVSLVLDAERVITVRFAELVAVQHFDDGARWLHGSDGFGIFVHPEEWVKGAWAVQMIDSTARPDLVIPMREPAGSTVLDAAREQKRRGR